MKPSVEIQIQGKNKSYPLGITPAEILREDNFQNEGDIIAAAVNGKVTDLVAPITNSGTLVFIPVDSTQGLEILRHSAAHVMAQAVKELFPDVKTTIGPAVEDGFYYDFDVSRPFTSEDLERIETRMKELVRSELAFRRVVMRKEDAVRIFEESGESYKVQLINGLQDTYVSLYSQGEFTDLCLGPHVPHSGFIKSFKLTKVAGAHWRRDPSNQTLKRIYGTAFYSSEEMENYLQVLEGTKKRDHRRIGKQLGFFSVSEDVGAGLVIWHPKGAMLRHLVEEFDRQEHLKRGYKMVVGPQLITRNLLERWGNFENRRECVYTAEAGGVEYGMKPVNCLPHIFVYKSKIRSYMDLPLRYFELGTVHRHEKSGELHGLFLTRQFTQDDAHIMCTPDQLGDEIVGIVKFVKEILGVFGLEYTVELSTSPDNSTGSREDWARAASALEGALKGEAVQYEVNQGPATLCGPKIGVRLKDATGRSWQCSTIRCDFALPKRFDLTYVDSEDKRKRPVMIHRVLLGSIERFVGLLIEHCAGAFPTWLSPVQASVMTIADRHRGYAGEISETLRKAGIRVEEDLRNEKIGFKVREALNQKVPYMIILGDQEVGSRILAVRKRGDPETRKMSVEEFVSLIKEEVAKRL